MEIPRELQALRGSLDARLSALEKAVADPRQHGSLETLILDLARVATDEADASARQALSHLRHELEAAHARVSGLEQTVAQAEAAAQSERAAAAARERDLIAAQQNRETTWKGEEAAHANARREIEQSTAAELASTRAELESARGKFESTRTELESTRGELDAARHQLDGMRRDVEAHANAASGTQTELEQALRAAQDALRENDARIAETIRERGQLLIQHDDLRKERDELRSERDALRNERDELTNERADLTNELNAAAEAAERELALLRATPPVAEIAVPPSPVEPAARPPAKGKTPAADTPATDTPTSVKEEYRGPARAAKRVAISGELDIQIDGVPAKLIDVSVTGAQILASASMKPNRLVRLTLPSGDQTIVCKAKIMWSRLEPRTGQIWYRAGVSFTAADQAALEAFLNGHSSSR